ncbi:MAG: Laminin G, domain-containing 2 [Candidatus Woesebacteria bacterium GW2011_GWA1_37_7]|uniref:Laminin G, domain-containing 2 n=1 Tax=Candidatus Woesebacteria bacterium GW2011_GWA1_37_7 TaxID=1618545 RepID=A0A0G0HD73_9BACT|nr:MAG: Laminin G, domain-containing 2 [Candidatus Woesebacteria bacterium GW2011_GWA1_37_7]
MKEFIKNKAITGLIVLSTVILAGVAIFTALKLYNLRQASISPLSPESQPFAWDCTKYTFNLDQSGNVTVENKSSKDEPSQQARIYIENNLVATLDVPALPKGQTASLGSVSVPNQNYSWRIVGTKDCQNSGSNTPGPKSCAQLTFTLSQPSPTPTVTPTPTRTPTPTPASCNQSCDSNSDCINGLICYQASSGSYCRSSSCSLETDCSCPGASPTPSPTPTNPPTSTPTTANTPTPTAYLASNSPTPTVTYIAAVSPTPGGDALPSAGFALTTWLLLGSALLIMIGAIILAL